MARVVEDPEHAAVLVARCFLDDAALAVAPVFVTALTSGISFVHVGYGMR
jgi:hypothetical protein